MGANCTVNCARKTNAFEDELFIEPENREIIECARKGVAKGNFADPVFCATKILAAWRGCVSRRKVKAKPLEPLSILKYIPGSHPSTIPIVKEIEDKLGFYSVDWDLQKCNETLELKKAIEFPDGTLYHGYWNKVTNEKEGYGVQVFKNGSKYEGFWKRGLFEGNGRLIYANGDYYIGNWKENNAHGLGTFIAIDGATYKGEWKNSSHEGHGIETWADGSSYEGNYVNGLKEGKGKFVYGNNTVYTGDFKANMQEGQGNSKYLN
jgi:hypothetical protein